MADKNQEGLNNIITAINNIVEPKINNSKFDRTFRAKVIKQADDEDYIVEINRIQYKLSYAGKLEPNQVVMVKAPLNNFSDIYIEPLPSSGGSGGTTNYDELVNKPALNTTISKKLNTNAKEVIKGTIELHKVSKTGSYKDLNDLPDLNFIPTSEKGAKSGVATLDSNIKVPTSQLPIATSDTLGVVKAGSNVSIAPDGTLSVNGITGNEITSVTVPGQITKLTKNDGTTFRTIGLNATSNNAQRNMWHNLGTFELLRQGNVGEIWIIGGDGQNSATYQNMWAHLLIKRGWQQAPSLEKYVGGTYEIFIPAGSIDHYKDVKFKLLCKEVGKIDVWIYLPYPYSRSFYYPAGYYDSFTVVNTEQAEEPVTGSVYGTEQPCEGGFISPSADGSQTTISVIDNLNSTSSSDALSANMGRELNDNLSLLSNKVDNLSTLDDLQAGDNVTITKQGSNYKISSNYPGVATKTNLGLVKIGDNINISSDGTISASLGTVNYNDLENKPKLNTNNSESQSINASEEISGTINLHKVAKTGNYNDLLNMPTLPTKTSDLTNDGNGTANSKYITNTELNSSLSQKQDTITGGATTIVSDNLTKDKALVSDENGKVAVSDTTSDELGYLSGARSNLQSQIDSITTEGGQPNVIEVVQENGTALEIINKTVNVIAPTNLVNGIAKGSLRGVNSTEENDSYKLGQNAFAIGVSTRASGEGSYAEGGGSLASGDGSHAEGGATTASGICSHAEGQGTTASRDYSHAEGGATTASGICSHAEGQGTTASQNGSHAEGVETEATNGGHAEGFQTKATGDVSHAEGSNTIASGHRSHAEGLGTEAIGNQQHVQGRYNISDEYLAHIVGNGSEETKSNAYTLDWDGNAWYAGNVYVGSTSGANRDDGSKKLITIEDIPIASQTVLGKIKVGSNLSIASDGTLSAVRNN